MRLWLTMVLTLIPMAASADLQNPNSSDADDCQDVAALITDCQNGQSLTDQNCQMVESPRGKQDTSEFLRQCRANFGGQ